MDISFWGWHYLPQSDPWPQHQRYSIGVALLQAALSHCGQGKPESTPASGAQWAEVRRL